MQFLAVQASAFATWINNTFAGFDMGAWELFGKLHSQGMTSFVQVLTKFGDTEAAVAVAVLGLILLIPKKTRKYGATLFLAIGIGTLLTNVLFKPLISRPRPYVSLADNPVFMKLYNEAGALTESDYSFPSGHTTSACEIATALFANVKKKSVKWIFPVYAILIACSRIYLCVHYCTDVIGGAVIGILAGILAYYVVKALKNLFDNSGKNKEKKKAQKLDELEVVNGSDK
jgi:undecaprenyl-diphosphatase